MGTSIKEYKNKQTAFVKSTCPKESPLIFYFNFCYFIFFVPFRFKWNSSRNHYTVHCNKLQCTICALIHIAVIFYNVLQLTENLLNFKNSKVLIVTASFNFVDGIGSAMLWFLFIKLVWFKKDQIEQLVTLYAQLVKPL